MTCDQTIKDCRRHGNADRFGGVHGWPFAVDCPHTFGDAKCGVKSPYSPPSPCILPTKEAADIANAYLPPLGAPIKKKVIGKGPDGRDLVFNDQGLVDYAPDDDLDVGPGAGADVESDGGFVGNVLFPKTPAKDCDECYGTGRFRGFGGPCSEGCPVKGDS